MITRPIDDVHVFKTGIFMSGASLFTPLVFNRDNYPPKCSFQRLEDCMIGGSNEQYLKQALSDWGTYAGPAGVGQYSLVRNHEAGALARFDIQFRSPTPEEIETDLNVFGDQMFGPPEVEVQNTLSGTCQTSFEFAGERYIYAGPPRVVSCTFNTRIFQGQLPSTLDVLAEDVERNAQRNSSIITQAWYLYHATEGRLQHAAFKNADKYSRSLPRPHGHVTRSEHKLTYYLNSKQEHCIDLSAELVSE